VQIASGPQINRFFKATEEKDLKMTHTQKYSAKDAGQTLYSIWECNIIMSRIFKISAKTFKWIFYYYATGGKSDNLVSM
jgi:hypothetical protein